MAIQCRYCDQPMVHWETPQMSTWTGEFQFVCFNDECPYFVCGWAWMLKQFNVTASYRYRLDPVTLENGPLPVWSKDALKSGIMSEKGQPTCPAKP